jgi:hypothetical protein
VLLALHDVWFEHDVALCHGMQDCRTQSHGFLWGHLKELIYRDQPFDVEDLVATLHAGMATTDENILQQVQASIPQHVVTCQQIDLNN